MRELGIDFDIYSLWGGERSFEEQPVRLFPKYWLVFVPFLLAYWSVKKPVAVWAFIKRLFFKKRHGWENFGENLLGSAFGLLYAHCFKRKGYTNIHAAWASMPAMAAWVIKCFTDIPFSMGAHAYDVFEYSGDAFLAEKAKEASFVHTSTLVAKTEMVSKGIAADKIKMIRRGLMPMPSIKSVEEGAHAPLRIISVGRLVEKKGYARQLLIYKALKEKGLPFQAKIIGEGPLRDELVSQIRTLGLAQSVEMPGWLSYSKTESMLDWADVFLFTGVVAKSGDRDGFPNVVGEAMAKGVPVVASTVSALPEVIRTGENGFLVNDYDNDDAWVSALETLAQDQQTYQKIAKAARMWVEENFDAVKNAEKIAHLFQDSL